MGLSLSQKVVVGLLIAFLIIALIRVFRTPLKLALRLLMNTLLGFLALWLVNLFSAFTGLSLGLNIWNALTIGILGLPGLVLLVLVRWLL
jgi:inhibitor of the pro-sigma K processing machinery